MCVCARVCACQCMENYFITSEVAFVNLYKAWLWLGHTIVVICYQASPDIGCGLEMKEVQVLARHFQ